MRKGSLTDYHAAFSLSSVAPFCSHQSSILHTDAAGSCLREKSSGELITLTCTKRHIDSRSQAGEESTTCESQIRTSLRSWWTPTPEVREE